jgi:Pyruvate/2-oxoacid:ferredoxin oxidoreductase gamma subunit
MLGALCRVLDVPETHLESTLLDQWEASVAKPNVAAAKQAYHSAVKIKGGDDVQ